MKRRWVQILVAVIVILVFVLSYVDFGPPLLPADSARQTPQTQPQAEEEAEVTDFQNPTGPPQIKGPTGPPPEE